MTVPKAWSHSSPLKDYCKGRCLFAFDFDGTLVPIVDHPDKVEITPALRSALEELASLVPIAVISGRKRQDLLQYVKTFATYAVGNHGEETGASTDEHTNISGWKVMLQPLLQRYPGLWLEDKEYSLSLHYRRVQSNERLHEDIINTIKGLRPAAKIIGGKFVYNLVASEAAHKGDALQKLMNVENYDCAIYIGDDENDEDVFKLTHPNILTIRVGASRDSGAQYFLKSQSDILMLVQSILSFVKDENVTKTNFKPPVFG